MAWTPNKGTQPHHHHQQQQRSQQQQQHQNQYQHRESHMYGWDQQWRPHNGTNTMHNMHHGASRTMLELDSTPYKLQWQNNASHEHQHYMAPAAEGGHPQPSRDRMRGQEKGPTATQRRTALPPFNRADLTYLRTSLKPSQIMTWRHIKQLHAASSSSSSAPAELYLLM